MLTHRIKRLAQTPRTFSNWPEVLGDLTFRAGSRPAMTFVTRSGQRISCPNVPGARVPIYEVYAEDCYRLRSFLGDLADEPVLVLDIGAHVGAFACQLAALAPRASIRCFEPSETTAEYLRRNVAANGFADRVAVDVTALSGEIGWATFSDNSGGSALNGIVADGDGPRVPTTTFDEVVRQSGAPQVVKIDCEGGEYATVLASDPNSWSSVQRVVLEYHPHSAHDWPQLRSWFAEQGLVVVDEEVASAAQGTAWLSRVTS